MPQAPESVYPDRQEAESVDKFDRLVVDVAIVGCGPVGAFLATLLGRRGHRVLVLERHERAYDLPRAVHFDHEVGRLLQGVGIGEGLRAASEPGSEYEWRNGSGQVLLRFGGREVGPSGWPDSNMFWQPALERLLVGTATAEPMVEVRRGRSVVGLDPHDGGVNLTVEPTAGGPAEVVEARWVVGCDGANSTVRSLVGAPVTDLGFFYDWLIVDVVLNEARRFDPVNLQVCDPVRPTTVVSGGPGRRRWEFMRLPHETVAELDDEARAWELLAPWDVGPGDAVLERHAVYRFQARWVDRWRTGRVMLAGDAAHQMPPFAGQGMCAGIRDAANLAWKLDLVLTGQASDSLLDSYERERAEHVRTVIDLSMALGRVICIADRAEAAERDAAMVAGAEQAGTQVQPGLPGLTAGIVRAGDVAAGELFVQGRIDHHGEPTLFDDVVGAGWRLVMTGPAASASPLAAADDLAWFEAIGGAVVAIDPQVDVDDTYGAWFAEHGVAAALQRPDLHLFGTAASAADVPALLADLRATLADPPDSPAPADAAASASPGANPLGGNP